MEYISKEAVLDFLATIQEEVEDGYGFNYEVWKRNVEVLQDERPKGHWDFRGDNLFRCTECGAMYTYLQLEQLKIYTTDSTFPNYCPKCGADMRGE